MRFVTFVSSHTIGKVTRLRNCIGLALPLAIFSALIRAIRLGNNSPKITERKVTIITMTAVAIEEAGQARDERTLSGGRGGHRALVSSSVPSRRA